MHEPIGELRALREDLKSYMDMRFAQIALLYETERRTRSSERFAAEQQTLFFKKKRVEYVEYTSSAGAEGEEHMKRVRILIRGVVVQDIGFRLSLYERADELVIPEFQARNLKEGVEVLLGGEAAAVDQFVELVQTARPEGAEVETINVAEYEGTIKPIERFAQSFMLTQMGTILKTWTEILVTMKEIKKDTGMMLEKQDQMLGKQDETIGELRALRENLKSYMDMRFARIDREIEGIKAKIGIA
jgi:acylphosphatase